MVQRAESRDRRRAGGVKEEREEGQQCRQWERWGVTYLREAEIGA